ncbi:Heat shock 70 kDa protein 12A [Apophysomyces sp. BC1021]|nr:Heat shock 70 kDa protein 12A [Apophysomyces sp. BC1021]
MSLSPSISGCSYALSDDEEIYDVIQWPKQGGFYAKPLQEGKLVQQFKLWLAEDVDSEDMPLTGQSVVDVLSDYMERFHEHILGELQKTTIVRNYSVEDYRYILTVPAIWSDQAKAIMRSVFSRAGIIGSEDPPDRLTMISEPEAAALYCERKYNAWNLQHGDRFMIVDAGGGTVDLIIYEIEQQGDRRTLNELTKGHGGMCGSAHIDNNMRKLLNKTFGSCIETMPSCTLEMIMETFVEKIKFNVDLSAHPQLAIILRRRRSAIGSSSGSMSEGKILLTAEELKKEVYGPVFQQVVDLVETQLQEACVFINAMFLVGGFGCSEYLYNTLRDKFSNTVGVVVMPPRGELAVVRGAVYSLLCPGVITSKILRRTYGVRTRLPFEEGLDPEESAIVTKDGVKRCGTRFDLIARKGSRIRLDRKISRTFWVAYPKHTEVDMYAYDGDYAVPRQITDPGVVKIADFPVKMPILHDLSYGDRVNLEIDFIFGLTELQINVSMAGSRFQFISLLDAELND